MTAFVIGAGNSVKKEHLERLRGRRTVAVNRMAELMPHASVVYFTDFRVWIWYRQHFLEDHPGLKFTCATPSQIRAENVVFLKRSTHHGLSRDPEKLCMGNNSGYAAINLAFLTGASRIVLYGFDMEETGGKVHCHAEHPVPTNPVVFDKMLRYFPSLATELENAGVECVNATIGGRLDNFERVDIIKEIEKDERRQASGLLPDQAAGSVPS